MAPKSIWSSKTFWFNNVAIVLAALWPTIQPLIGLSGEQAAAIAFAVNQLLRAATTQPVTLTPPALAKGS